jgi:hypothetical protein
MHRFIENPVNQFQDQFSNETVFARSSALPKLKQKLLDNLHT